MLSPYATSRVCSSTAHSSNIRARLHKSRACDNTGYIYNWFDLLSQLRVRQDAIAYLSEVGMSPNLTFRSCRLCMEFLITRRRVGIRSASFAVRTYKQTCQTLQLFQFTDVQQQRVRQQKPSKPGGGGCADSRCR